MTEPMYCYRHPKRETLVSCSECGRPICEECMTFAPVGIRCPEHSGQAQGPTRAGQALRRASFEGTGAIVTKLLIGLNVAVYLLELAAGGQVNGTGNEIYEKGALFGPAVADGDWWRLFTAAFLHYGPLHLGMNMLALWWFGAAVEQVLGRSRYLLLYLVSGLAGSAGAVFFAPTSVTVGASGAIFGILGSALVLERQRTYVLGGGAMGIILINLIFTFAIPGISIGGHLGGLAGGALGTLALSRFGRGHAVYGRPGLLGVLGVLAVGVVSIAVAYWRVQTSV